MSPIALSLDLLLALLLATALVVGVRLNGRLKALKESHANFARSVDELNQAAARAEAGLAALHSASEEVHDSLLARIETARALIAKLERTASEAERAAAGPRSSSRSPTPSPSLAAIAAMAQPVAAEVFRRRPAAMVAAGVAPPIARRNRSPFDEDLFVAPRTRDPGSLGPLKDGDGDLPATDAPQLGPLRGTEGRRR